MEEHVISVGIDVGTTTTNLIFSRLKVENIAGVASAPLVKIIDKEIIYRSGAFFTPLLSQTDIDTESLIKLIDNVYNNAGINKNDVKTGAVIITGETARKNNADKILHQISSYAGDFVVAVAGSDLESIIAGKGAGSSRLSKEHHANVVNLDIGGGTTNIVLFNNGNPTDTTCLDIGGRMVQVQSGAVVAMTEKAKKVVDKYSLNIRIGERAIIEEITKFCKIMADVMAEILGLKDETEILPMFITNHDWRKDKADYLTFSGGVADYIYGEGCVNHFQFGDIGPLLGAVIKQNEFIRKVKWIKGEETQQATVIGAGAYSVDLSGSTIEYALNLLPFKNIPIIKLSSSEEIDLIEGRISEIKKKIEWYGHEQIALSFVGSTKFTFVDLQNLAANIASVFDVLIKKEFPLIIVVEKDMAKALGMCLKNAMKTEHYPIVCIDSVIVENGDYIDIGLPIGNGIVLPVMIKTLVFNEKHLER